MNQVLIIFVKKKDIVVLKSKALNNSLNEKNERTSFIEIGFDHCVQSWDKTF